MRASSRRSHHWFCVGVLGQEPPAQHVAVHLQPRERGLDVGRAHAQPRADRAPTSSAPAARRDRARSRPAPPRASAGPARRDGGSTSVGDEAAAPATPRPPPSGARPRPSEPLGLARAGAPRRRSATSAANRSCQPRASPIASGSAPRSSSRSCSSSASRGSGCGLRDHRVDRRRVEPADALDDVRRQPAAHADRARPPLLQRRVVQERVRVGVQDLVREHRRLRALARDRRDAARRACAVSTARSPAASIASTRQSRTVSRTSGWSGISIAPPPWLSWQAVCAGNTAASRSCARMRCSAGGTRLPPRHAQQRQRPHRVPAPARLEHRRLQRRLHQQLLDVVGAQHREHRLEREAVLRPQRQHDAVVGGRRLQLEVERPAEALAQRHAPRAVDAAAERRVDDQLHAARLVEEALGDDARLRRHAAQRRRAGDDVVAQQLGAAPVERARDHQRRRRILAARRRRARSPRAAPRPPPTARACAPAPRPARTGSWAARPPRPRRAPGRARRGGCATTCCRAG